MTKFSSAIIVDPFLPKSLNQLNSFPTTFSNILQYINFFIFVVLKDISNSISKDSSEQLHIDHKLCRFRYRTRVSFLSKISNQYHDRSNLARWKQRATKFPSHGRKRSIVLFVRPWPRCSIPTDARTELRRVSFP